MSQAEALLNSLAEPEVEEDNVLIVDGLTRLIKIPSSVPNLGVENDGGVLRLRFRVPRYVGDADLSEFTTRINYSNARGGGDVYEVDDLQIVDDHLEFSWQVKRTATIFKGSTKFSVCMRMLDSDGLVLREFNTVPAILPVLEGLETTEQVVYEYADVLSQWHEQLIGAGDSSVNRIEEKFSEKNAQLNSTAQTCLLTINSTYETRRDALYNVGVLQQNELSANATATRTLIDNDRRNALDDIESKRIASLSSIPDDYTEVLNNTEECYRKKAEAIVMSASGDLIALDDSSDTNLFGLKVYGKTNQVRTTGKQIFDDTKFQNNKYQNYDVANGLFDVASNASYWTSGLQSVKPNTTYRVSPSAMGGVFYSDATTPITTEAITQLTFTTPANCNYVQLNFKRDVIPLGSKIMLNEGQEILEWEAYSGGYASPTPDWPQPLNSVENARVNICGGNLFNFDGINECTGIVRNADYSITCSTYACSTGLLLRELAPNLIVGKEYKLTIITDGPPYIYLGLVQQTWTTENKKVITQAMLDSPIYIYGKEGNAPALIERIWITPSEINISYESYATPQLLNIERVIRGIPVSQNGNYTDSNGQQWVCDEIDFERGKFIQRVNEVVLDGTQSYVLNTYRLGIGQYVFCYYDNTTMHQSLELNYEVLCDMAPWYTWGAFRDNEPGAYCLAGFVGIHLHDPNITTIEQFKAYTQANPIKFLYQLATPIETDLTEAELVSYKALKTHSTNSVIMNDDGATMLIKYGADIKSWLPKNVDIELPAADWLQSASQAYYYQVLNTNVNTDSYVELKLTSADLVTAIKNNLTIFANNENGSVMVYSVGGKPSADMTAKLIEQRTERV